MEATIFTGAIFVIIILETLVGMFFFSRKKNKKKENVEENPHESKLLCRFVLDGTGRKIGESVAFDDDIIIIKSGSKYLGVPLKHIEEDEKTLLVKGLVDQDKAELMGEKWRQGSFREMNSKEG